MKKKIHNYLIFCCLLIVFLVPSVQGESYIINSVDWRDIYSGLTYARITSKFVNYIPSERAGDYIISPHVNEDEINIISSRKIPFKFGYEEELHNKGLIQAEEYVYDNINLALFQALNDSFTKFIVIDDSYGYNAISVVPYAVWAKHYVLFMDKENINQYMAVLDDRDVEDIIIYGIVDRAVRNALEEYNPEIINYEGDRFLNNIEISKRYRQEKFLQDGIESNQVLLTNGEFLEDEIMSGSQPVLFIGRMNVPDVTREYIQNTTISVGVLIGNELIDTAQFVKNVVGISTFVKFGRSARNPGGLINEVEDLDRYPVPKVTLGIDIENVKYNKLTSELMITIVNTGPIAVYLKGTYSATDGNPDNIRRVGDENTQFLESGETKTFVYSIERIFDATRLDFDGFVLFGESKYSLEFRLDSKLEIEFVDYEDDSMLDIIELVYFKNRGSFIATVENIGNVTVYFNLELQDIIIMDVPTSYGAGEIFSLEPGEQMKIPIEVPLDKDDYQYNDFIKIISNYGKNEDALIKRLVKDFDLNLSAAINFAKYLPTLFIIILIILILLEITKEKCPNCKVKNSKRSKHCKKCGHHLK